MPGPRSAACRRASSACICDLVLDRGEQLLALREASFDRLLLRRALGDDLGLVRAGVLEARPACLDRLPVPLDLLQDPRVLARDALDGVEPSDDVVEAARAEDHLERRVSVAVHVQVAEALGDPRLRDPEALSRGLEMARVRAQVGVDPVELDVRVVVRLDRLREARVELLENRP